MVEVKLKQAGRAAMAFEVSMRQAVQRLHKEVETEFEAAGVTADSLPDAMAARHALVEDTLSGSRRFAVRKLLGDICAVSHGLSAIAAFDDIRDDVAPQLEAARHGPSTLDYSDGFVPPAYWSRTWFHRSHGGWDGDPDYGFIHGEIIHKQYVAKVFPGDIYGYRRQVARLALPNLAASARILEIGTSSGHYTVALSEVYPDAELHGLDPSPRMLEQARRVGNGLGQAWHLKVGVGEDLPYEDESFDMVTAYAVHHEVPPRIVEAIFAEAYRVLRPGGTVLIADVPRYADLDRLAAWRFDWLAQYGGEPFWGATASLDFAPMAQVAGFGEVQSGRLPPLGNPYYVMARKPQ